MKCSKVRKLISAYIDSEVSPKERETVGFHVKECDSCAAILEEMQNMHNLFAQVEKFNAPFGFSVKVMANVTTGNESRFSWIWFSGRLAQAVVLLMIAAMGTISGKFVAGSITSTKGNTIVSSLSLDVFNATPPDSLGGAYLAMMEGSDEKR